MGLDSLDRLVVSDDTGDVAELEISEGDWVTFDGEHFGVVVATKSSNFTWPTSEDSEQEIEVGEDETWAIVARETGGSKPFPVSELEEVEGPDTDVESPEEDLDDAEMSRVYYIADDPHDVAELERARDELQNIPGVDDPGVGFDSWPDSWEESEKPARLIALDAWTSLGATFTSCVADMRGDISRPKRFCASFKDTILGTERWRNRF